MEKISFHSDGLKIAGLLDMPNDYRAGERRPAFIVLHGFGGNKDGQGQTVVAQQLARWGYVSLRIDFRGCGDSEGEHGRIICLDQVADTQYFARRVGKRDDRRVERLDVEEARPFVGLWIVGDQPRHQLADQRSQRPSDDGQGNVEGKMGIDRHGGWRKGQGE